MSDKYHIPIHEAPPRFAPVSRYNRIEIRNCMGCLRCVKRDACVYGAYLKGQFDPSQVVDTTDVLCVNCLRCLQECKGNIITRARNPLYDRIGDDHWTPEIIAGIWKQAETGRIPVSGAGYRGPFAGPGFDEMWTDMSEIVRPTRDGIHGREYISTVIELGLRPDILRFDADGGLRTRVPPFLELPIPVILEAPANPFVTDTTRQAIGEAARILKTMLWASVEDLAGSLAHFRDRAIARLGAGQDLARDLGGVPAVEAPFSDSLAGVLAELGERYRATVLGVEIPLDEFAVERTLIAARAGAGFLRLRADRRGRGLGARQGDFVTRLVREAHFALLKERLRDRLTIILSGGIAMAEHMAKTIACGADGVCVDTALLAAMECRLCPDCEQRDACPVRLDEAPVRWGGRRIANMIASWHSQLIEVLGAMGLREARRLRGELGRAMFFDDLERENFGPVFGARKRGAPIHPADGIVPEALELGAEVARPGKATPVSRPPSGPASKHAALCPSRYRNMLGRYQVARAVACIACGECVKVCAYGVHKRRGPRILEPTAALCRGAEVCRQTGRFCADHCPAKALRVGPDPVWETFGDPRWTPDLIVGTWRQAETGLPPDDLEYRTGASGGGFDRIGLRIPERSHSGRFRPEAVDLSIPLNRRSDGRPRVTIGFPVYGGGMSFGSISLPTMLARARAYGMFGSFTCTGEGGYPKELKPCADSVITQVATGLFGVREDTIRRARIVEFKYAQGAKPGLGGHLLGDKVTPAVAALREAVEGSALFSPFPFHSVYSVEDHKKHVDWIKQINPRALVSVKVSTPSDVDMVAVGSYYAGAHIVHLDGSYGGTGAAPDIAKKNIAMPIEYAIPKVHRFLKEEGVREAITLVASGGLRSAWDAAKAIALGADGVVIGTAEMVALECVRCGVCESGRGCPRGIATTDPELAAAFDVGWATQRLVNLFSSWRIQLQGICWRLGMRGIRELVGRSDLLRHLDYEGT
ncbi:MAG: glutamate synthase-related protein [Verrucomicrobiota bacterium]|nr:glutamate synthase-related protein [Verrucomicrobiota bacterium]